MPEAQLAHIAAVRRLKSKGWRSRNLPDLVAAQLSDLPEEAVAHARKVLTGIANKDGKMDEKDLITGQLIFFSPEEVHFLAEAVRALWNDGAGGEIKKFLKLKPGDIAEAVKKAQARAITLDIALFGRMVTSAAFVNVEASMQVAHSRFHARARSGERLLYRRGRPAHRAG